MYLGNILRAGDFAMPVPVGLPVTLQYSDKGILEKVYSGYYDMQECSNDILQTFHSSDIVPITVPIRGGTTWVKGILYTDSSFSDVGQLPDCVSKSLIDDFLEDSNHFVFYAGNVDSRAAVFKGASPIVNWLYMAGYKVLPSFIVPANSSDDIILNMLNHMHVPFSLKLISGFMIYRNQDFLYESLDFKQTIVTRCTKYLDEFGFIRAKLNCKNGDVSVNYSDAVSFNIHPNTLIVLDGRNNIVTANALDGKQRDARASQITCSVCGRMISVPKSGKVCCTDPHCASLMYPRIQRFLQTFKLPMMLHSRFIELTKQHQLITLADVFELPEYSQVHMSAEMSDVLYSLTCGWNITESDVKKFVNACNNNLSTVLYYANHVDLILSELHVSSEISNWFKIPENLSELSALLKCGNIDVQDHSRKFDGDPIFSGRGISITGDFKHGSSDEVSAILRSYDAVVNTDISDDTDFLIVGDIMENISSRMVQYAKSNKIPIYQENSFFRSYQIDDDLNSNLM